MTDTPKAEALRLAMLGAAAALHESAHEIERAHAATRALRAARLALRETTAALRAIAAGGGR